jgi:hypothetical protein
MNKVETIIQYHEFIKDVLDKVKAKKLTTDQAFMSISSLLANVYRDAREESAHECNVALGEALLNFSMEFFNENEPWTTKLFREFLLEKAKKADRPTSGEDSK